MTAVRLPSDIEARLSRLSTLTHRPKSFYIREALKHYLEDMEDIYLSMERITDPNKTFLSTEQVLKDLL